MHTKNACDTSTGVREPTDPDIAVVYNVDVGVDFACGCNMSQAIVKQQTHRHQENKSLCGLWSAEVHPGPLKLVEYLCWPQASTPRFLLFLSIRIDSLRPPVVRLSAALTTGLRFVIHFQLPGSELLSENTYTPWTVFLQKHSQKSVSEKHTFRTMHYFPHWY